MSFGTRLRERRLELKMSQGELAKLLGVTPAAVSNYESGQNFVREDVLLRMFRILDVDPNYLYQDFLTGKSFTCSVEERALIRKYRALSNVGRHSLRAVADALESYQEDLESTIPPPAPRQIPLYSCLAAVGYTTPVLGEDFEYMDVEGEIPDDAELAIRICDDTMEPYIANNSMIYLQRTPLTKGDVGIFCVNGEIVCKQYVRDSLGMVYLFALNRSRADADITLSPESGRALVCFGRVLLPSRPPLPQL